MGIAYTNAQSNTGTCTATAPAAPGTTWSLTSLVISQAGPVVGPNAKLNIWDGAVGSGTLVYSIFLSGPQGAVPTGGSVGMTQKVDLPVSPQGFPGLQGSPGNAMNIQVVGTGANTVSINARFSDGLP